jgi:hypothetical protein
MFWVNVLLKTGSLLAVGIILALQHRPFLSTISQILGYYYQKAKLMPTLKWEQATCHNNQWIAK